MPPKKTIPARGASANTPPIPPTPPTSLPVPPLPLPTSVPIPVPDDDDDAATTIPPGARPVPCIRCLTRMAKHNFAVDNFDYCEDDKSASTKCSLCKKNKRECRVPLGPLKTAAMQLMAALTPEEPNMDLVQRAQLTIRKLLQGSKNDRVMSASKAKEKRDDTAAELRERQVAALEQIAAGLSRGATLAEGSDGGASALAQSVATLSAVIQQASTKSLALTTHISQELTSIREALEATLPSQQSGDGRGGEDGEDSEEDEDGEVGGDGEGVEN